MTVFVTIAASFIALPSGAQTYASAPNAIVHAHVQQSADAAWPLALGIAEGRSESEETSKLPLTPSMLNVLLGTTFVPRIVLVFADPSLPHVAINDVAYMPFALVSLPPPRA